MDRTLPELRRQIVRASQLLHQKGWVANHDGNISIRLPGGRVLITPTALSKGDVRDADLVEIDFEGRIRAGSRKPPSEMKMHLCAYKERSDVHAVVHAHPPESVGHAICGLEIPTTMMPEPIVSIGERIPLLPFQPPGSADLHASIREASHWANCLLLEHHGPLILGADLEQAMLRLELVEHLARIHRVTKDLGGPKHIPTPLTQELLKKHRQAGLAPPRD
jgi:L-fuculose-phosphate aldolase